MDKCKQCYGENNEQVRNTNDSLSLSLYLLLVYRVEFESNQTQACLSLNSN